MKKREHFRDGLRKGVAIGIGLGMGLMLVLAVSIGGVLIAQSLNSFSSGTVVSADAMNANFIALKARLDSVESASNTADTALNARVAPIGGIIAWHNAIGGVPTLPAGWVLCDGSVIADAESPLNGQTTPNLNNAPNAWNTGGYFLRGSTTAGGTQLDAFQGHRHNRNPAGVLERDMGPSPGPLGLVPGGFYPNTASVVGDPVTGLSGTVRVGSETRPVSFLVVWIMRIK